MIWAVVSAFNEQERLGATLAGLLSTGCQIVVVDDGSTDRTSAVAATYPVWRLSHPINCGAGAALRTGITFALAQGAEIIVSFDGDGQHEPSEMALLVAPIIAGTADVVLGSRFLGQTIDMPWSRGVVLSGARWFTRLFSGIDVSDPHNGLRAFSRAAAQRIRITQDRMAHASEIVEQLQPLALRWCEVPVTVRYTRDTLAKGQSSWNAFRIVGRLLSGRFPLACAIALLVTLATYANHFHNDFHFDDSHTIQNNAFIRDLRNIPGFFTNTATFSAVPANQSYRPLVTTTLAVDYWLGGGLHPFAFHVTSFALFLAQCGLMFVLYRRVMDHARPDAANRWLALFATALYALHPANAETVNYIIARSEILSTLGVVLALVMFAGGGAARRYHLYLIPAALGVLGKETGAMFAPLLFLYVAFIERDLSLRESLRPRELLATLRVTWPSFLVCVAIVGTGMRMATTYTPGGVSRWHYLLTQPFVIVHYLLSLFLPLQLSADTQWPLVVDPLDDHLLIGIAVITGLIALAWVTSRRREARPVAFGVLWFFVALLPTSSVVPLAEPMNDHRMFFPFVGLILAAVWGAGLALNHPKMVATRWTRPIAAGAGVVILLAMAYGTRQRNIVWHSEESLWLDATIKSPDNGRGLMNYGVIQLNKGNYASADDYFERALRYTPNYAYLHVNIGILKGLLGQAPEAERHFREAQRFDPNNPVSYTHFARWLATRGRTEEARLFANRAVELSPADADARNLLNSLLSVSER